MEYDFSVTEIHNLVERQANLNWQISLSDNTYPHILALALEGGAYYSVNGGEPFHVQAGDLCYFPPGAVRSGHSDPKKPWRFMYVAFSMEVFSGNKEEMYKALCGKWSPAPAGAEAVLNSMHEHWVGKQPGYRVQCRALLMGLLYQLVQQRESARCSPAQYRRVENIRRYLQEHMTENPTMDELSTKAGCSNAHFRMLFRKVTGMTVSQYLNFIRVSKAKDLLEAGEANVTEAAERTGFHDVYYFSRVFRRVMGCPPSDFLWNQKKG
ncbi:MAG: AraC family transcriptional regulator [Acutalibacteraceae bacterium]|jgi:AraC-like DNA-binding protein